MQVYRVLVVEDTDEEATSLRAHLERYGNEHGYRFSITRRVSAFDLDRDAAQADLVFLDIDLPGINGMDAAAQMRQTNPTVPLVFVTNLAQYAVKGYQVDALDFMVKPVSYGDFALRMDRAMRAVKHNASHTIALPTGQGVRVVDEASIRYVELRKHDLLYHVQGTTDPLRKRGSIRQAREELSAGSFITASQGCLVNMDHVAEVHNDSVTMDDGQTLFFSRSRKRECLETLARYFGGA